jgi:peptide/nickel transport system permease protein
MRLFGARFTPIAAVGVLIILVSAGAAALAPWLAPHDPNTLMGQRWEGPSTTHWLGLDHLGRDMFSRLLYGGRASIALALLATLMAFAIGLVAGLVAAIFRRWADPILSGITDVILSVPVPISALIVIAALGSSAPVLIVTIGLLYAFVVFRAVRAAAVEIVSLEYVEAARLRGENLMWLIRREILPNALVPLAVEFGLRFCFALMLVAGLSFLDLGVAPPDLDWGSMVKDNALAIPAGVAAPLYPALAIAVFAAGVNMVVDWLRSLDEPHGG